MKPDELREIYAQIDSAHMEIEAMCNGPLQFDHKHFTAALMRVKENIHRLCLLSHPGIVIGPTRDSITTSQVEISIDHSHLQGQSKLP